MKLRSLRGLVIFGAVAVTLLATPPESKAIFHWFRNRFQPVTTFQPVAPVPPCNPCAQQVINPCVQQTVPAVQYVPQTAYRRQVVNVPVTTMQPCMTTDPCTGCPVTTYRPVTAYRQQVRLVPYTTYRVVRRPFSRLRAFFASASAPVAAPVRAQAACCGQAPGMYTAPAAYGTPAYGVPVGYGTPAYSVPGAFAPAYGSPGLSPTPVPSLPPSAAIPASPESAAMQTYQGSSPGGAQTRSLRPESQPQPLPDAGPADLDDNGGPRLNAPTSGKKNHPIPHTWTRSQLTWPYSQVVWPARTAPQVAVRKTTNRSVAPAPQRVITVDDGGWRASSR